MSKNWMKIWNLMRCGKSASRLGLFWWMGLFNAVRRNLFSRTLKYHIHKNISGFYNWNKIPLECVFSILKALTLLISGCLVLLPDITMQRVLVVGVSLLVWDIAHKIQSRLSLKMCQVFHRRWSHQIVLKMIESFTRSCNIIELSFIFVSNSNDFDSL